MKTALRKIFVLVALCLAVCLCGCDMLDQARMNHGIFLDGNVVLNGNTYLAMDVDLSWNFQVNHNFERNIYLTQPEVPVLLREQEGEPYSISREGTLLVKDATSWDDTSTFYCREDAADEVKAFLSAPDDTQNVFCFRRRTNPSTEKDGNNSYVYETLVLTNPQVEALQATLKQGEPFNGYLQDKEAITVYRGIQNADLFLPVAVIYQVYYGFAIADSDSIARSVDYESTPLFHQLFDDYT